MISIKNRYHFFFFFSSKQRFPSFSFLFPFSFLFLFFSFLFFFSHPSTLSPFISSNIHGSLLEIKRKKSRFNVCIFLLLVFSPEKTLKKNLINASKLSTYPPLTINLVSFLLLHTSNVGKKWYLKETK
ncbi:hypothetical protein HMI56_001104 [Coelomomyces lativittatus]|nr:hypothetical protein HMI56_001104 [Coelomomyces lativittatus]